MEDEMLTSCSQLIKQYLYATVMHHINCKKVKKQEQKPAQDLEPSPLFLKGLSIISDLL